MTVEYKMVRPVLKALDDQGTGQAVIATLNTIDHDMDVTRPGAFGEQWVKMVPAHEWKHPAIGKARLREVGNTVVADFKMYLQMHSAMEWYQSLKADMESPPHLQEWSYGFRIVDHSNGEHEGKQVRFIKKVSAIEISPVMKGAGVGTHTLSLKEMQRDLSDDDLFDIKSVDELTEDVETDEEKQGPWKVQTLIFPKARWDTAVQVRSWLGSHDYKADLDETSTSWRARQEEPSRFEVIRARCFDPGPGSSGPDCRIMALGGPMREAAAAEDAERKHLSLEDLVGEVREQVQHLSFIQNVRERDGKSLSDETRDKIEHLWNEFMELRKTLKLFDPEVIAREQAMAELQAKLSTSRAQQRDEEEARERAKTDEVVARFQSVKAKAAALWHP